MSRSYKFRLVYIPLWVLTLALLVVAGCGEEGGSGHLATGLPQTDPPMEVPDGTFEVVATAVLEPCGAQDYNGTYQITFTESGFTMNEYTGVWTATPSRVDADGETPTNRVTTRGCTISTWKEIDLTFTNADSFVGSIIYKKRTSPVVCDCCDKCTNSYTIVGTRVP